MGDAGAGRRAGNAEAEQAKNGEAEARPAKGEEVGALHLEIRNAIK